MARNGRLGLNPTYKIPPGDYVSVALYGRGEAESNLTLLVDSLGMIFVPNVGPIKVVGVEHSARTPLNALPIC